MKPIKVLFDKAGNTLNVILAPRALHFAAVVDCRGCRFRAARTAPIIGHRAEGKGLRAKSPLC